MYIYVYISIHIYIIYIYGWLWYDSNLYDLAFACPHFLHAISASEFFSSQAIRAGNLAAPPSASVFVLL